MRPKRARLKIRDRVRIRTLVTKDRVILISFGIIAFSWVDFLSFGIKAFLGLIPYYLVGELSLWYLWLTDEGKPKFFDEAL